MFSNKLKEFLETKKNITVYIKKYHAWFVTYFFIINVCHQADHKIFLSYILSVIVIPVIVLNISTKIINHTHEKTFLKIL